MHSLAAGSPSVAETTYLQLGIRGIDESISQNRVPVLNVGTTGEKKNDNKDLKRSQLFPPPIQIVWM